MQFRLPLALLAVPVLTSVLASASPRPPSSATRISPHNPKSKRQFLAVPDAKLAGEHLKTLTAEPHLASTPGGPQNRRICRCQIPRGRP